MKQPGDQPNPNELLDLAYSVESPDDNRQLYRRWASSYDADFVEGAGYVYHENVVHAFVDAGAAAGGAIADVGCGTGIVGVALGDLGVGNVDGLDISPEMLDVAREKRTVHGHHAYRNLIEVDLTRQTPIQDDSYLGVISTGTFTHGHLGPETLNELIRIAAPTALCAIGINEHYYELQGFDAWFAEASAQGRISSPDLISVSMYESLDGDHGGTRAALAMFTVSR